MIANARGIINNNRIIAKHPDRAAIGLSFGEIFKIYFDINPVINPFNPSIIKIILMIIIKINPINDRFALP